MSMGLTPRLTNMCLYTNALDDNGWSPGKSCYKSKSAPQTGAAVRGTIAMAAFHLVLRHRTLCIKARRRALIKYNIATTTCTTGKAYVGKIILSNTLDGNDTSSAWLWCKRANSSDLP